MAIPVKVVRSFEDIPIPVKTLTRAPSFRNSSEVGWDTTVMGRWLTYKFMEFCRSFCIVQEDRVLMQKDREVEQIDRVLVQEDR